MGTVDNKVSTQCPLFGPDSLTNRAKYDFFDFYGPLTVGPYDTVASDPGRQMYLQRTHVGALGEGKGLTGVEVRSTFNGTAAAANSEVKGGEFKARHTDANTYAVGTMKGVVGNVDSKKGAKTITSAWAVEGQIDCGVSSTITTGAGLRVAYNEDGAVTKAYGVYIDGASVWDIGVYCRGGKSVNAIQVGENGVAGGDVLLYGATTGCSFLWDASANSALIVSNVGTIASESHSLDITSTGTLASGKGLVGLNVVTTPGGTEGTWASGVFAAVTMATTKRVNGYISAAEFEVNLSGDYHPPEFCTLCLNANNDATGAGLPNAEYIRLRDYGDINMPKLLTFYDVAALADGSSTAILTDTQNAKAHNVSIRCSYGEGGGTTFWLMGTTQAPD